MTELLEFRTRKEREHARIFEEANRRLFIRECIVADVDPSKATISPSLAKLLREQAKEQNP